MKITFLGTNGWYPTTTGDTPCILIETQKQYVVLDAGNGIYKLDRYIRDNKPIFLFITHFHLDHTSGLHILGKFDFKQGIEVYVGGNRAQNFKTLVNPPFTVGYETDDRNILNLKTEIRLHELSGDKDVLPFKVKFKELRHGYGNHGFRFVLEGKNIVYTGDCGLSEEAEELVRNADLLIAECSNKKTVQPDLWGHLDPESASTLARDNGVGQMILTHFGSNKYVSLEDRRWAEEEAKKIFPKTIAAVDGLEFII